MNQLRHTYQINNSTIWESWNSTVLAGDNPLGTDPTGFNSGAIPDTIANEIFDSNVTAPLQYTSTQINQDQGTFELLMRFDAPPIQKAFRLNKLIFDSTMWIEDLPRSRDGQLIYGSVHVLVQIIKTSQYEKLDAFLGLNTNRSAIPYSMPDSVIGMAQGHLDRYPGMNNAQRLSISETPNITITPNDFVSVFVQIKPSPYSYPAPETALQIPNLATKMIIRYFGE